MMLLKKYFIAYANSNPHTGKVKELKDKLNSYQELSVTANELGDAEAFTAVQAMYRETYMELLAISFCESLYSLLPHIIFIWLLSLMFGPLVIGKYKIGILLWYPAIIIFYKFILKRLLRAGLGKYRIIKM